MTTLLHREQTDVIIGAYYEVYNHTLRTYPEAVYERAMLIELDRRGFKATQQDNYRILYKGRVVGIQQLDLFVLDEVVVENKVAGQLTPLHKAQGLSYLKTVGKMVGLVLNFGGAAPEFERLYLDPDRIRAVRPAAPPPSPPAADWLYPDLTYQIVGGLYAVQDELGAGFVHRIYANACYREFQMRGLAVQPRKRVDVVYKGVQIGNVALAHLLVEDKVMVFPVAYQDRRVVQIEVLRDWMRMSDVRLGIMANFQENRLSPVFVRV